MFKRYFVPILLISLQCAKAVYSLDDNSTNLTNDPERQLEFCEMADCLGCRCEQHKVTTEDGYILTMHHIYGDPRKPVLLVHGFQASSVGWIVRKNNSLAACLYHNGYDLWLGNTRGNMYSRNHTTLNPDKDEKYWDFSFHEMAEHDIPAMIDCVLDKTGQKKLQVIGHSQGTLISLLTLVLKPAYVLKIKIIVCLAPIAYLQYAQRGLFYLLSLLSGGTPLSTALGLLGRGECLRNSSELVAMFRTACTQNLISYEMCVRGVLSFLFGYDPDQCEIEFSKFVLNYFPCGSSSKNVAHLGQIALTGRLQQFDYGIFNNLIKYGSCQPPLYDLHKVSVKVSLYCAGNDPLSDLKDVAHLKAELNPDVLCEYYVMPYALWNHVDYVWARDIKIYLCEPVLNTLKNNY